MENGASLDACWEQGLVHIVTWALECCRAKATGGKTFGPYGGCQGDHFPYQQCSLKKSTAKKVYEAGELQPYTSGFL